MEKNPPTILIIGSIAWDEIIYLPGPLRAGTHNTGREMGTRIGGGAANTAMALAAMPSFQPHAHSCPKPIVVSAVGKDAQGTRLVNSLRELGIDVDHVNYQGGQTTRSLVLLDESGERTIINLTRAVLSLSPDLTNISADCCYIRSADPALTPILKERIRHGPVIAHIPPTTNDFRPAQVLVGSASDLDDDFLADPFSAGRCVAGNALEWVVITSGATGAIAYGDGVLFKEIAPRVHVKDTTGAGDVFAAGLAFALSRGEDMPAALKTAVSWGSASVRYYGTVPQPDCFS
uniref:Sugar or nucleoside kinase, ribokinase family n=1 Tax=Candidatus Kentrum sp. TUN TaxID=2126343 RepID=A0A450ZVD8_9GAMM|nr:MAG: Sugar or nucleoside kinase, ribokinase family [Candidatus Kentron sp. TUN]VFK57723.1 MAG: Sugar or nucleoside kinase, ribokinase family [Candidatus Kentron sp. TUN]VFK65835.1 MAG: Sugar or nucleoside kinase, ribokinase family [Candidatus Kentron sp. TUN]